MKQNLFGRISTLARCGVVIGMGLLAGCKGENDLMVYPHAVSLEYAFVETIPTNQGSEIFVAHMSGKELYDLDGDGKTVEQVVYGGNETLVSPGYSSGRRRISLVRVDPAFDEYARTMTPRESEDYNRAYVKIRNAVAENR